MWDIEQRRIACPPFGDSAADVDFIHGTPFVITAMAGNPCSVQFSDRLSGRIASPTLEIPGSNVLILAGDRDGYRRLCGEMLTQFESATDESDMERTIKTCLLQSEAVDLADLPIETLDKALSAEEPTKTMLCWGSAARALYSYRAGDMPTAIDWANKCLDNSVNGQQRAFALAVQSMSLQQLEPLEAARSALREATDLIHVDLAKFGEDRKRSSWQDWLIADMLRQEAHQGLVTDNEE